MCCSKGYARFWFPKWLHILKPVDVNELPGESFQDRHRVFKRLLAFAKEDGLPDAAAYFQKFNGRALGKKSRYLTRLIEIRGPFVHILAPARRVPAGLPTSWVLGGGTSDPVADHLGNSSPREDDDGALPMDDDKYGCCCRCNRILRSTGITIREGGFDIADIISIDSRQASSAGWTKITICYRQAGEESILNLKFRSQNEKSKAFVERLEHLHRRWSAERTLMPETPPGKRTPRKKRYDNPLTLTVE